MKSLSQPLYLSIIKHLRVTIQEENLFVSTIISQPALLACLLWRVERQIADHHASVSNISIMRGQPPGTSVTDS